MAVKVQRPGATAALWLDAHVMRCVARALHHTAPRTLGRHHLVRLVDELVGRLFEELDYSREAARQRQFRTLYATAESQQSQRGGVRLRVPAVYSQLCSTRVLVTEWVDGTRLTDSAAVRSPLSPHPTPGSCTGGKGCTPPICLTRCLRGRWTMGGWQLAKRGVAVRALLEAGVRGSVAQLLTHGVMHADPHPGNLLLDQRGDLVYVDFGMVAEVASADRVRLMRLLVAWVNVDAVALAEALRDARFLPSDVDLPAVVCVCYADRMVCVVVGVGLAVIALYDHLLTAAAGRCSSLADGGAAGAATRRQREGRRGWRRALHAGGAGASERAARAQLRHAAAPGAGCPCVSGAGGRRHLSGPGVSSGATGECVYALSSLLSRGHSHVTAQEPPTVGAGGVLSLTMGASDGLGAQAYPYVLRRVLQDRSPAMRQVRV